MRHGLVPCFPASTIYAQNPPPFQHVIVVVQENRTPDNLFGSNPTFESGVNIAPVSSATSWCLGACFNPGHGHDDWKNDYCPQPNWCSPFHVDTSDCPNSLCNGSLVTTLPSCPQETYVDANDDRAVIAPYFDIAKKYGFANYFFQTNEGPSFPAHQFLLSGTSAPTGDSSQTYGKFFAAENPSNGMTDSGCTATAGTIVKLINYQGKEQDLNQHFYTIFPCFDHPTLPSLLNAAGKSWRYYANTTGSIWNAPNAIQGICFPVVIQHGEVVCNGSDWLNNVVINPAQVLIDVGVVSSNPTCNLANMSWVIPDGSYSDHPGFQGTHNHSTDIEGGPAWVAAIVNAVGHSPCHDNVGGQQVSYWNDTAILIVWDDWGGFYDHVRPYEVLLNQPNTWGSGYVSGFRVPFLVVSAYTQAGYVSGSWSGQGSPPITCPITTTPQYCHDFGSILAFIENNFLGASQIGKINQQYPFADAHAPDGTNGNIPLSDFFPPGPPQQFRSISIPAGAPDANYFINYTGTPEDPDNDATDTD